MPPSLALLLLLRLPACVQVGLQVAMLLVPSCYLLSGVGLAVTEGVIKSERDKAKAAAHLPAEAEAQAGGLQ